MLNKLHQLTKITLTALLLAMIAWLAIDVLAIDALAKDASDNNQHHPSLHHVQEPATATPSMASKLNQVGITPLESPPTECALTRSPSHQGPQNRSFNSVEYPLLSALPHVILISPISLVGSSVHPPYPPSNDWAAALEERPSAPAPQGSYRTLGSCTVSTPADSGAGTLRQCLSDITANGTITFDSQAFPPNTPSTISLSSALPSITTDGLTIDGTSAGVVLDGTGLSSDSYGLGVDGANGVTIKGLQIVNFLGAGIFITNGASNSVIGGNNAQARNIISGNKVGIGLGGSSNNNQIIGNYIGTDATGMNAWGNEFGIALTSPRGAQNNIIGGPESEGNLISGNGIGVQIEYEGANSNQVLGNFIGTDATGMNALGNGYGILVRFGAQNNTIGGESSGARNIISGNTLTGVHIQDAGTNGNQVLGNFIGTDITGSKRLDNKVGVVISANPNSQEIGPTNNVIGGTSDGARNIISGNTNNGIQIEGPQATNNRIEGNYIGTNVNGTQSLGHLSAGIVIQSGAHHNLIGGDQQGAGNLISGNGAGIAISGSQSLMTTDNFVQSNYIGTDLTGRARLPNKEGIVIFENAHRNIIGGLTENARNIISGNENSGIWIGQERRRGRRMRGVTENQVLGNYIGPDVTGQVTLGNKFGIVLNESQDHIIGCESLEGCNIISGNSEAGIMIQGAASVNQVIGNYIGTNADGTSPLANGVVGIGIIEGSHHNIIGGQTSGTRNVISGNTKTGVDIRHAGTMNNEVIGNYIGTDKTGTMRLPNNWGVGILEDADHNIVGGSTAEKRNIISGNNDTGVQIQGVRRVGLLEVVGEGADHNRVQGNYIGTDVTGLEALSNKWGIAVLAAKNNLIGGPGLARNIISGNLESGIEILSYDLLTILRYEAKDNEVQGNLIGLNADEMALGNGFAGICLFNGTTLNTIGPDNIIAYNADAGVRIQDSNTLKNKITENSIHHNSRLPIDLIDEVQSISPPILNNWTDNVVEGSACQGCTIEIFANPDATPAGTLFLATGTADQEGSFTIALPTVPTELSCLSATTTDPTGTTEEFSDSLCAGNPPSATTTPTVGNSPTATPTAINSSTVTPTAINSPTATPTAINSSTATPTVSNSSTTTPTVMGSSTATPTTSNSPTATPTVSNSPTATTPSNQIYLPLVIR